MYNRWVCEHLPVSLSCALVSEGFCALFIFDCKVKNVDYESKWTD